MTLPAALLQRLAQRGLVQKQKNKEEPATSAINITTENEEVIAEDYDEEDTDEEQTGPAAEPSQYDHTSESAAKRPENFWLERMKARMGEAGSAMGHKGCPNKYNIWHKCNLYCLNRWADGKTEPSRDYLRRYKRLLRKYPLPKGWTEMYDPGCGCFYFYNTIDSMVSWLPPTHPKSQISRSAASLRRQMEESTEITGSDDDQQQSDDDDNAEESSDARHQREIDEIINASIRPRSPLSHDYPRKLRRKDMTTHSSKNSSHFERRSEMR